ETAPGRAPDREDAGMSFDAARQLADAVLYEGYVLYPYRASAAKNRFRWQFGVVAPRGHADARGTEPSRMRTKCLLEAVDGAARVEALVRFLQVQARTVERAEGGEFRPVESLEACGEIWTKWEEGVERQAGLADIDVAGLLERVARIPIGIEGGSE